MNFAQTVVLGAIAGLTIYLGLPIGRVQHVPNNARGFLTLTSVGILVFLLFDIFGHIKEPIDRALAQSAEGKSPFADVASLMAIFVVGLTVGLMGLVAFEMRFLRASPGSGQVLTPARLALMIATG